MTSGSHLSPNRTPEAALLLVCARLELTTGEQETIRTRLAAPLDWSCLIALAARHRLSPLLFRHLNALDPRAIPRPVFVQLWARHEGLAKKNEAMARELLRLLALLEAKEIQAVPFKGPTLARTAYGDLSLREFGDLDILVPRDQVLRARNLLGAEGYTSVVPIRPEDEQAFLRAHRQYDFELFHEERGLMVELHWRTSSEFPIESLDDPAWWSGLGTVELAGGTIPILPLRELLLVLLLHGTKHHWSRLSWLVDVAELIRQNPSLDWPWMIDTADRMGCRRRVAVGLRLALNLLDAPLPEATQEWVSQDGAVQDLASRLERNLFLAEPPDWDIFQRLSFDLDLCDRPRQRARHLLLLLFTPNAEDWGQRRLPRALAFLYFPGRLIRLAWKYARRNSTAR